MESVYIKSQPNTAHSLEIRIKFMKKLIIAVTKLFSSSSLFIGFKGFHRLSEKLYSNIILFGSPCFEENPPMSTITLLSSSTVIVWPALWNFKKELQYTWKLREYSIWNNIIYTIDVLHISSYPYLLFSWLLLSSCIDAEGWIPACWKMLPGSMNYIETPKVH